MKRSCARCRNCCLHDTYANISSENAYCFNGVITCVFLLQAAHYDVPNSLMDYDVINERLDKMIARIEENKNE